MYVLNMMIVVGRADIRSRTVRTPVRVYLLTEREQSTVDSIIAIRIAEASFLSLGFGYLHWPKQ